MSAHQRPPTSAFLAQAERRKPLGHKVLAQAAAATLVFSYPFYAVVAAMRNVGSGDNLVPCNEEPCHFLRLFDAGGLNSTFGDHVRVQNGMTSRPVLMTSDLASATIAQHEQPLAREYMIGLGAVLGGYLYQIPLQLNTTEAITTSMFCVAGVCVDNNLEVHFFFSFQGGHDFIVDSYHGALDRENSSTDTYLQANSGARHVLAAVDRSADILSGLRVQAWRVYKGPCFLFQILFTGLQASGVEDFPSALKNDSHPVVSWNRCARPDVAKSVDNPLADSRAVMIYLMAIAVWTILKVVHDWMVILDYPETVSLHVGIFSLYFEAVAIGAGFEAAMGATQGFVAYPGNPNRIGVTAQDVVCFFKLNRIGVTALIATPCLLLVNHTQAKKSIFMAIFCGDFLHHRKETVPYKWLEHHSHNSWPSFSGMVADPPLEHPSSTLGSTSGRTSLTQEQVVGTPQPTEELHLKFRRVAVSPSNLLIFWANIKLFQAAELFFAIIPMAQAAGSILPFSMGFIVQTATVHVPGSHGLGASIYQTGVALTMCGPALAAFYFAFPSIKSFRHKLVKHLETPDKEGDDDLDPESRFRVVLKFGWAGLRVLFWLMIITLLLPPSAVFFGLQVELLPYYEFWSVGGFWLTLSAFEGFLTSPEETILSLWLSLHLSLQGTGRSRIADEEWWLSRKIERLYKSPPDPKQFLAAVQHCPDLAAMFGLDLLEKWVAKHTPPHGSTPHVHKLYKKRWERLLGSQTMNSSGDFEKPWEELIKTEKKYHKLVDKKKYMEKFNGNPLRSFESVEHAAVGTQKAVVKLKRGLHNAHPNTGEATADAGEDIRDSGLSMPLLRRPWTNDVDGSAEADCADSVMSTP